MRSLTSLVVLFLTASATLSPGASAANRASTDISVIGLNMVASNRTGRTQFSYTYKVLVRNAGAPYSNVNVSLVGAPNGTTIVQPTATLSQLLSGAVASTDTTITISQDRTTPFDPSALKWSIAATLIDAPEAASPEASSSGVLKLASPKVGAFNPVSADVAFSFSGGSLSTDPTSTVVIQNDFLLPKDGVRSITPSLIDLGPILTPGLNHIVLYTVDSSGAAVFSDTSIWAGSSTLTVTVIDASGNPVIATVTARLADDHAVSATQQTSASGTVAFQNLPPRAILLEAHAGEMFGTAAVSAGLQPTAAIIVRGVPPPSSIKNHDFSKGTAGWDIGGASVTIVPHTETITKVTPERPSALVEFLSEILDALVPPAEAQAQPSNDLVLSTNAQFDPQTITYTFVPDKDSTTVKVRYRFVTQEVPGGYCGTQYNDFYAVTITTDQSLQAQDQSSMNGLGCDAFSSGGSTVWKTLSLTIPAGTAEVEITLTVSNVVDNLFDSEIIANYVQEQTLAVKSANLFDTDDSALTYLSSSVGSTQSSVPVHGTITLDGTPGDEVDSVKLEMLKGASVVGTGALTEIGTVALLKAFDANGEISVADPTALFRVSSTATSGNVTARISVHTTSGQSAEFDGTVSRPVFTWYQGGNYGFCDPSNFGCSWAKQKTVAIANKSCGFSLGDFSNVHGGNFPPHASHQTGNDFDGFFSGYGARDATVAAKMIQIINCLGGSVTVVGVTYSPTAGDPFYDYIVGKQVLGRPATDVIRPWANHGGHFHVRVSD